MNIRRHYWEERLKISKLTKFESDMSEVSEDIALQSRKILQTFVWWGAQSYVKLYRWLLLTITFKLGKFTHFKVPFPVMSIDTR